MKVYIRIDKDKANTIETRLIKKWITYTEVRNLRVD